jgi:hypothetical protein
LHDPADRGFAARETRLAGSVVDAVMILIAAGLVQGIAVGAVA